MRIPARTQFSISAIFLNSFELISSHSFWKLFPETLGDFLPPINTLGYEETDPSWNLRKLVDHRITEFISNSTLIARANLIVGWRDKDNIEPLSDLSGRTNHVFDMDQKLFIKLNKNDLKVLGVNRRLSKIRSLDEASPLCRPTPKVNVADSGLAPKHHTASEMSTRVYNQIGQASSQVNVEVSSSSHTFRKLFPEILGDQLPPIRTLKYKETGTTWNLRKLVGIRVSGFFPESILIARAHVLIGWPYKDIIKPLSDSSGTSDLVFDSIKEQFLKLNENDIKILGVGSRWSAISALDEATTSHRPNPEEHSVTNHELKQRHTPHEVSIRENDPISQGANNQVTRRRASLEATYEDVPPASRRRSNPQEDHDSDWLSLRLPGQN